MMADHPDDDDNDADRKTRLVMRPDVTEPAVNSSPRTSPRSGSVIGTTRLVGMVAGAGQAPIAPGQPTVKMQAPLAKTQFVRAQNVDIAPVAGWIVVVKGPGRGGFRPVFVGMNSIGRASSQRISVEFGDETISREEHAFITYDDEQRTFYLHHGGKANLIRLGDMPLLQPAELKAHDEFRIGNTTFRFFPCCGPDFDWSDEGEGA